MSQKDKSEEKEAELRTEANKFLSAFEDWSMSSDDEFDSTSDYEEPKQDTTQKRNEEITKKLQTLKMFDTPAGGIKNPNFA